MLAGKRILITGLTGFVGSRAAARFLEAGARVRGLVRRASGFPGVEEVFGDITDAGAVGQALEGADLVVHGAVSYSEDFAEAERVNVEGTRLLAAAALQAGCERFVHLSTCGAYNLSGLQVVTEDSPLWSYDPQTALVYGVTKAEAERVIWAAAEQGLAVVVLRPPNILGAHPRSGFAAEFAEKVRQGRVRLGGDGSNTWPYVHVENFLDAVQEALLRPEAVGQAYNIVDGQTTFREFAGRYAGWLGVPLYQRPLHPPYDLFKGRFSTEKARRELGYQPRRTYEQAMEETRQFLQETGVI